VGHVEDGRVGVGVDGHDHVGALHAGQVLDGAADPAGDVDGRGYRSGFGRAPPEGMRSGRARQAALRPRAGRVLRSKSSALGLTLSGAA